MSKFNSERLAHHRELERQAKRQKLQDLGWALFLVTMVLIYTIIQAW